MVTIVIPIYNVEKYLDRCVNSVVNQTYTNLEILLIDDGSPDNCPVLCDAWAKKDSRIVVIHKINAGLGMARNTGIKCAKGKYICFADSDDYIERNTIELSVKAAEENNAEIVIYGGRMIASNGRQYKISKPNPDKKIYHGDEVKNELMPQIVSIDYNDDQKIDCALGLNYVLIALDTIRKRNWQSASERDIISEDTYSLYELYSYVNSVVVIPEALYNYCQNDGSITKKYRSDRYDRIKDYYEKSLQLCKDCRYPESVLQGLSSVYLSFVIGALKTVVKSDLNLKAQISEINKILKDSHLRKVLDSIDMDKQSPNRKIMVFALQCRSALITWILIKAKA